MYDLEPGDTPRVRKRISRPVLEKASNKACYRLLIHAWLVFAVIFKAAQHAQKKWDFALKGRTHHFHFSVYVKVRGNYESTDGKKKAHKAASGLQLHASPHWHRHGDSLSKVMWIDIYRNGERTRERENDITPKKQSLRKESQINVEECTRELTVRACVTTRVLAVRITIRRLSSMQSRTGQKQRGQAQVNIPISHLFCPLYPMILWWEFWEHSLLCFMFPSLSQDRDLCVESP